MFVSANVGSSRILMRLVVILKTRLSESFYQFVIKQVLHFLNADSFGLSLPNRNIGPTLSQFLRTFKASLTGHSCVKMDLRLFVVLAILLTLGVAHRHYRHHKKLSQVSLETVGRSML